MAQSVDFKNLAAIKSNPDVRFRLLSLEIFISLIMRDYIFPKPVVEYKLYKYWQLSRKMYFEGIYFQRKAIYRY